MKQKLKPRLNLSPQSPEIADSVAGVCSPSHRLARRVSVFLIAFLLLTLLLCSAMVWWNQPL